MIVSLSAIVANTNCPIALYTTTASPVVRPLTVQALAEPYAMSWLAVEL